MASFIEIKDLARYKLHEKTIGSVKQPSFKQFPNLKLHLCNQISEQPFEAVIPVVERTDLKTQPYGTLPQEQNEILDHPYYSAMSSFFWKLETEAKYVSAFWPGFPKPTYQTTWIGLPSELNDLVDHILESSERHVFITIEVNETRSYRGITCVIFLNFEESVYAIDAINLVNEMKRLQLILGNPKYLKIVHSRQAICKYFEKDFSLFFIGLLDIVELLPLNYKARNLHDVINSFKVSDRIDDYYSSDFRLRPLKDPQVNFGFLKCFYLSYLYMQLVRSISPSLFYTCINNCKDIREFRYTKPEMYIPDNFKTDQRLCYLYIVRDAVARFNDVNPYFLARDSDLTKLVDMYTDKKVYFVSLYIHPILRKYKSEIRLALSCKNPIAMLEPAFQELGMPAPKYRKILPKKGFKKICSKTKPTRSIRQWFTSL